MSDIAKPLDDEIRAEMDRIKRAMGLLTSGPDDEDREDLISYARHVLALRAERDEALAANELYAITEAQVGEPRREEAEALRPVSDEAVEAAREGLLRIHDTILNQISRRFVVPKHPDTWSRWSEIILDAAIALDSAAHTGKPTVSIQTYWKSKERGEADYFIAINCCGREVTPHRFTERYQAEYHLALYRWLFNGGEKPDLMAYDETDWPSRSALQTGGETS